MLYLIFIITCFLLGIYFIIHFDKINNTNNILEGFIEPSDKGFKCPNVLIQKGVKYYLYNSKLAEVPGVNPIQFEHLEDYVEFMDWQRSQGIRCPILYLQHSYNAQGDAVYKVRPDPLDVQGGLPPAPPINTPSINTSTPSCKTLNIIDSNDFMDVSKITEKDTENMLFSPNAMDSNWGGVQYTEKLVEAGVYDDDNVSIYIP
jgi:hypothetical protein